MVKREVIWTKTAALQRRLILEYWAQRNYSTTYSIKLLQHSNEKIITAFWDNRQDPQKLLTLLETRLND